MIFKKPSKTLRNENPFIDFSINITNIYLSSNRMILQIRTHAYTLKPTNTFLPRHSDTVLVFKAIPSITTQIRRFVHGPYWKLISARLRKFPNSFLCYLWECSENFACKDLYMCGALMNSVTYNPLPTATTTKKPKYFESIWNRSKFSTFAKRKVKYPSRKSAFKCF